MNASLPVHEWTDREIDTCQAFVGLAVKNDRSTFDKLYESEGLRGNYLLRASLASISTQVVFTSFAFRRLIHLPPSEAKITKLIDEVATGSFDDAVDSETARAMLWTACGRRLPYRERNTDLFAVTCIVLSAVTLRWSTVGSDDEAWSRRYRRIVRMAQSRRTGVFESFRQSGADAD